MQGPRSGYCLHGYKLLLQAAVARYSNQRADHLCFESLAKSEHAQGMSSFEAVKKRILQATPLAKLVEESLPLQRRAGQLIACCPFHAEKTPSFYLYDDHYHCFGCGAHGDAISFVQQQQGLGFWEALKWLAQKYSIPAEELSRSSRDLQEWQKHAGRSQILVIAQNFFQEALHSPEGEEARRYLLQRGFGEDVWQRFGFGYALDKPRALIAELSTRKISLEAIEAVSLASSYGQTAYDFFRHRLTLPIRDLQGRIIAFAGRALGGQQQKYKNSRYDKASHLYAMDTARKAMAKAGRAIVVEGYLDALSMQQFGFGESVACQGTALSREHIKSLKGACKLVYLLFDGDQAGRSAALKVLAPALEFPELRFKVALLPPEDDPDSFLRKQGPEALSTLLATAEDLLDYAISQKLQADPGSTIPHTINHELVPWLAKVGDPVQRSFLVQKVAQISGVTAQAIQQAMDGQKLRQTASLPPEPSREEAPPIPPPLANSAHAGPLAAAIFELAGHLFYSKPSDGLDIAALKSYISTELETDAVWLFFLQELLDCLASGQAPAEQGIASWVTSQAPPVLALVQRLEREAQAFATPFRKKMLARLQLWNRQHKLKRTISTLKDRLLYVQESHPDALAERRRLGQELIQLHQNLQKIHGDLQTL